MERESVLEMVRIDGAITIQKKRFVFLGNGKNMSKSVLRAWSESWDEYKEEDDGELWLMETTLGQMVICASGFIVGGGPSTIEKLLTA